MITALTRIGGLEKYLIAIIVTFASLSLIGSVGTINFIGIGFRWREAAVDQRIRGGEQKTFTFCGGKKCHNRQTDRQIADFSEALRPR